MEEKLNSALLAANAEIYNLREKLDLLTINENFYSSNDRNTLFYTGLPSYRYMDKVFKLVESHISHSQNCSLTKFQQFALTLMKLRHNFPFEDLGHRFSISRTTASRCFYSCIDVLYKRLKKLIIWPERENLIKTMPQSFKESFGNKITVIIDCFEIFIEKPSNKNAASQTWSSYKHHNTIKYLIGICPQGSICFISDAFGGRASDKYITEHSGFLDHLLPGDLVLTDRGFTVQNTVRLYMAEVLTPAFLKGQKQLHPKEVEATRKIAHVRIHVERVIGTLRQKYKILSHTIPISTLSKIDEVSVIDKIVTICCALTNISPSVVPLL